MSKYCLFLIVIYYLTGGNNSMSRFFKFGKLHVTKGNGWNGNTFFDKNYKVL